MNGGTTQRSSRSFSSVAWPPPSSTSLQDRMPMPICFTYPHFTSLHSRFSTRLQKFWGLFPEIFFISVSLYSADFSYTSLYRKYLRKKGPTTQSLKLHRRSLHSKKGYRCIYFISYFADFFVAATRSSTMKIP